MKFKFFVTVLLAKRIYKPHVLDFLVLQNPHSILYPPYSFPDKKQWSIQNKYKTIGTDTLAM